MMLLAEHSPLTAGGWAVMLGGIGLVCFLCVFCAWRILRKPAPAEPGDAPRAIDARDGES